MLPLFGHFLSVADYGVIAILFPAIQFLQSTFAFGLNSALLRYYYAPDQSPDKLYVNISISWIISLVVWLPVCIFLFSKTTLSAYTIGAYKLSELSSLLLITSICLGVLQITAESFRAENKPLPFVLLNILPRILIIIMVTGFFLTGHQTVKQVFLAILIASLIAMCVAITIFVRKIKFKPDLALTKEILIFS